jgi:chemotaxis protein histidine kinase CheA
MKEIIMANADVEAKEKAAEVAKVKAEKANIEAELAKAEAALDRAKTEAVKARADQEAKEKAAEAAKTKAEKAKADAAKANDDAVRAKSEADQTPDQEDKVKAAEAAQAKAEKAKADAAKAKADAAKANDDAVQAKSEADQAKADAVRTQSEADQANIDLARAKVEAEKAKAKAQALGQKPEKDEGGDPWAKDPWAAGFKFVAHTGVILINGFLALFAMVFLFIIAWQLSPYGTLFSQLRSPEVVRGFITFLIALGTIAIAIMLVIAAFLAYGDTPLKDRFDMGKGVLTALIGILGTIVGFYFGTGLAEKPTEPLNVADVKVDQTKAVPGGTITLSFQVTGGKAPYDYTVTFPDRTIPLQEKKSKDGKVKDEIAIPATIAPNTPLTPITIEVTDSDKKNATQEMKEPEVKVNAKESEEPQTRYLIPATPMVVRGCTGLKPVPPWESRTPPELIS